MIKERIIHQVWIGPKEPPEEWMQTWKDKHPTWNFIRWDNDSIEKYPFINKDKIKDLMRRRLYHGASDVMGYQILHDFGGFIAKADTVCFNPIDELMNIEEDCFTAYEQERWWSLGKIHLLTLHLATIKGCSLMRVCTEKLKERIKRISQPWIATGNLFFTKLVESLHYPIKVYPSYTFSPTFWDGFKYEDPGKIYAEHYWGTTKNLYKHKS